MRRPLQQQITVPMIAVMVVTLIGLSMTHAWFAARQTHRRLVQHVGMISRTLTESTFPLTDRVLDQMHGLSGAHFVVTGGDGQLQASSYPRDEAERLLPTLGRSAAEPSPPTAGLALNQRVNLAGTPAYHAALGLRRARGSLDPSTLHVIYPVAQAQRAWLAAVLPPMAVGAASLVIVVWVGQRMARRFTRPIFALRDQVTWIAAGGLTPVDLPERDDELRELAVAVNHMVRMLSDYEQQVRRDEQLRTLSRLGAALAHQIRNSVTGARLAIELHRDECPLGDDEAVAVAVRQLDLLEGSLQRFLRSGDGRGASTQPVDVAALISQTLPFVMPQARHHHVELDWDPPPGPMIMQADAERLREVLLNLLLNAIEAAAESAAVREGVAVLPARVTIRVEMPQENQLRIEIADTGAGPAQDVREKLFEPLVSTKPEGLGLGLALVQDFVTSYGGGISWRRDEGLTRFVVDLPLGHQEKVHVESAGRR